MTRATAEVLVKHWIHIGTQKAASSYLRGLLAQVPDVALANRQELNFFCEGETQPLDAYLGCFPRKAQVLFENSPLYLRRGAVAAPAIAATFPEAPMLSLFLRDPVEAIISHHRMRMRQGYFERPNPYSGDASDLSAFVRQNPDYIDDWRYMDMLEAHWLDKFPMERFAIRTFEDFTDRPKAILAELLGKFGQTVPNDLDVEAVWRNQRPASALANWLLAATKRNSSLRYIRHQAMKVRPLRAISERMLFRAQSKSAEIAVDGDSRTVLADLLRPDVDRLCRFMGRDSLPWPNFYEVGADRPQPAEAKAAGR